MGNLVVGQGERLGSSAVQVFQSQFFLDVQPAVAAKDAIGKNDLVCLGDSVFGQDCDPDAFFFIEFDQVAGDLIDCPKGLGNPGIFRSELLQVIIEVGQINQRKIGFVTIFRPFGRFGDPLGRLDPGFRAPKGMKREGTEVAFDFVSDFKGVGMNVESFQPVGTIKRARRDRVID